MMQLPQFSEFTFGYALTDNLISACPPGVKGVPIFPSLKAEGKEDGGYDVEIPRFSAPLFLQFKLPQVVKRKQDSEQNEHPLSTTFYRMHLMRRDRSPQHASLVKHASRGREVYYVTPEFSSNDEINTYYIDGTVHEHCAFFAPEEIGPLEDDKPHHVAYELGNDTAWLCSKPRALRRGHKWEDLKASIEHLVSDAQEVENTARFFESIARDIIATVIEAGIHLSGRDQAQLTVIQQRLRPRGFAAYVSRLYLDSQLIVVGRDKPN